jgi:chromosome partitioning protein
MSVDSSDEPHQAESLPEAKLAPQVFDVEFTEEELPSPSKEADIGHAEPRPALDLPTAEPTPDGRARVVTVINQKGGVAKTTTVINVAARLATFGNRVLVVDCDAQGNCATGMGIDKSRVRAGTRTLMLEPERAVQTRSATSVENLHLVVGDRSLVGLEEELISQLGRERKLAEGLAPLLPHYDIVLIDTPPSLGQVTINALVAADAVLIPVQTEYFALEGLALLASTIREVRRRLNPRLGVDAVVLTMHAPTLLNAQVAAQIRETFPDLVVDPPVRRNIRIAEAPSHGVPIHVHAPDSAGGRDYLALAKALAERWGLASEVVG